MIFILFFGLPEVKTSSSAEVVVLDWLKKPRKNKKNNPKKAFLVSFPRKKST